MLETEKDFINELKPWMVFYFRDVEVSEFVPHYFVIINSDIKTAPVLVLPVATSQIEKRIKRYDFCNLNKECLVIIEPEKSNNILSKRTAFDCNEVKNKDILELYNLCVRWKASYEWTLPDEIIEKLKTWVLLSNQVEKWIKELV